MTREEAIKEITNHLNHWKRLKREKICSEVDGENAINSFNMAIKALEQEPSEDAISREEITSKIEEWADGFEDGEYFSGSSVADTIRVCIGMTDELPSVTPTQKWISVSDGLPNIKNQTRKYLVTLKDKTVCDVLFTECDGEHWWNYNYGDVIAWQELPKAYKANMENNK